MDLLPCQDTFWDSCKVFPTGWHIYRCEIADELCAVSGPDTEILLTVCDKCDKKPADLERQTDGLSLI